MMLYGINYDDTKETDEERRQREEDAAYVEEAKDYLKDVDNIWEELNALFEDAFDNILSKDLEERFQEVFEEFLTNIRDEVSRRESDYDAKGYGY